MYVGLTVLTLALRQSELRRANARNVSFLTRYGGQFTFSTWFKLTYRDFVDLLFHACMHFPA